MHVNQFQAISNRLLKKHFGIDLNDTHLSDAKVVQKCIDQGYRPYQVVAEHADEADLCRIDKEGFYGVPSKTAITVEDEKAVIAAIGPWEQP